MTVTFLLAASPAGTVSTVEKPGWLPLPVAPLLPTVVASAGRNRSLSQPVAWKGADAPAVLPSNPLNEAVKLRAPQPVGLSRKPLLEMVSAMSRSSTGMPCWKRGKSVVVTSRPKSPWRSLMPACWTTVPKSSEATFAGITIERPAMSPAFGGCVR